MWLQRIQGQGKKAHGTLPPDRSTEKNAPQHFASKTCFLFSSVFFSHFCLSFLPHLGHTPVWMRLSGPVSIKQVMPAAHLVRGFKVLPLRSREAILDPPEVAVAPWWETRG